jgi:hypothetical protein
MSPEDLSKVKQIQDGRWVVVWPREWAAPGPGSFTLPEDSDLSVTVRAASPSASA